MSWEETRAWLGLSLNLAVLPGLGTLLLRRWAAGAIQLLLSAGGALGAISWLVWFLRAWARLGHFPVDRGPLFPLGVAGSVAFVLSWVWSGRTAWEAIRVGGGGPGGRGAGAVSGTAVPPAGTGDRAQPGGRA